MEEYRYDGTDFTKNKKTFPVWNITKKIKMVYNLRNGDEKQHYLIQIDNEKKLY